MSKTWEKLSASDRIVAVHVDISNNKDFAGLSGVVYVGDVKFDEEIGTAGTDGRDVHYAPSFLEKLSRKQLRYVVLHEAMHKALQHCTNYNAINEKYPQLSNIAMDYVVNATLEEIDPNFSFIERTTEPKPLVDKKYEGWSFIEVLQDLLNNSQTIELPQPMDVHMVGELGDGDSGDGDGDEKDGKAKGKEGILKETARQIDDALRQGKILADRLAGKGSRGSPLDRAAQKRDTNWREHMRDWITALCEGDEYSRFAPPNKRLLPLGVVMPSHFSEATGELIIACDTSGSMGGIYPTVFGEIARIVENVQPDSVRMLWWDCAVCGDQLFKPHEYANIASLLKPAGGGGTSPECVVQYIREKKYQPKGVVWLTDGYLDGSDGKVEVPALWGVVDNDHFTPPQGKAVRIYSH
jgi:predicted metal-dependent peptidase